MLKLELTDPRCKPRSAAESLCRELREQHTQEDDYRTYFPQLVLSKEGDLQEAEFITSKDVYLKLGLLSRKGLRDLLFVLMDALDSSHSSQFLLQLDENEEWSLLVSRSFSVDGKKTVYRLSPVR